MKALFRRIRPVLGWFFLVSALGFAVWTWQRRPVPAQVVLLLSHADRAHLVELHWRVVAADGVSPQRGSLHFAAGAAPEATAPLHLHIPYSEAGFADLQVQCRFAANGPLLTTRARLRMTTQERQTLDLCSCCDDCGLVR